MSLSISLDWRDREEMRDGDEAPLTSLLCLRPPLRARAHNLFVFFLRFPPNAALVIDAARAATAEIYDGADFRLIACLEESFLKCAVQCLATLSRGI